VPAAEVLQHRHVYKADKTGLDVNLAWCGIVTELTVEIGLLTPPFGISVFVIKPSSGDPDFTLGDIFACAAPFAFTMLAVLLAVILFPMLATGLLRYSTIKFTRSNCRPACRNFG